MQLELNWLILQRDLGQIFANPEFKLLTINTSRFDANKHLAQAIIGDAKVALSELSLALGVGKQMTMEQKAQVELKVGTNMLIKKVGRPIKNYLVTHMLLGPYIEILTPQI